MREPRPSAKITVPGEIADQVHRHRIRSGLRSQNAAAIDLIQRGLGGIGVACRPTMPTADDRLWREIEDELERHAKYPASMGSLYAIVALCQERPIKIGFAVSPLVRLKELQTGNAFQLEVLGTIRGGKSTEEMIHRYLASDRLVGEWFASTGKTLGVVARFTRSASTVALLPTRRAVA